MKTIMGGIALQLAFGSFAYADLLVSSYYTSELLKYNEVTGESKGTFTKLYNNERPIGMVVGADGNIYVGVNNFSPPYDSYVIRVDGKTGKLIDRFATEGGMSGVSDLTFGPDGNLYVSSFGGTAPNSKVTRYNASTGEYIDDFVPVGSGGLSGATGIAFGPDKNLYVTSRATSQVLRYDGVNGQFLGVFATGTGYGFQEVAFGSDGNLYVLNNKDTKLEVLRYDGKTGDFIDIFVSEFDGGTDGPKLVFGPNGDLFITTGAVGHSVMQFDGVTGQLVGEFVSRGSGGLYFATGLIFHNPAMDEIVKIDVRPNAPANRINIKSKGVVPVAILTTKSFDALKVNLATVRFGSQGWEAAPLKSVAKDIDRDGDLDKVLEFRISDLGLTCKTSTLVMTGKTLNGVHFKGKDGVYIVGCK